MSPRVSHPSGRSYVSRCTPLLLVGIAAFVAYVSSEPFRHSCLSPTPCPWSKGLAVLRRWPSVWHPKHLCQPL